MAYYNQWTILEVTAELAKLGMYAAKNAVNYPETVDKTQAELEAAVRALIAARDALNKHIMAQHKAVVK